MNCVAGDGKAFVRLMRRYVVDYTNRHDQDATQHIMVPEYRLIMGEHIIAGRDSAYRDATARQMAQFPGLSLTVHEIVTSGERLAMRFSEHGASKDQGNRSCSWGGIGLYEWNGSKLTSNYVEQDYYSRRRQLLDGIINPVENPAIAPWDTKPVAPNPAAEAVVRAWLASGTHYATPNVLFDDQRAGAPFKPLIDHEEMAVDDLFSCGGAVAFRATERGRFMPVKGFPGEDGAPAFLHMTGLVHVTDRAITSGRVVRNRLDLMRRMRPAE